MSAVPPARHGRGNFFKLKKLYYTKRVCSNETCLF